MWHGGGGYRWLYTDEFISLMICGLKGVVTRKLCNTPMRFNCAQIVWKEEYESILVVVLCHGKARRF